MIYPGSDIRLLNLPLEAIAPGKVASGYSYTNTTETGGDQILTDDPAGQVLHFACNRDVGVYRRVMVDGQFGPPVLVTGLPLLNGFSLGWKDVVLHLLGLTAMYGPTVHYQSIDWGQSFTFVETIPGNLAPNRQVVYTDGEPYFPVHYALNPPFSDVVSGMWSLAHGLQGAIHSSRGNVGLSEPALGLVKGDFLLVGRTEDTQLALPLSQTFTPFTPAVPMFIDPVLRVGGSPPCLAQDGDTPILGYAPTSQIEGQRLPYWNIYTTINGLTWNLLCRLDSEEPNYDLGQRDAYRYMSMAISADWLGRRWLFVVGGEPDNALRAAQEVRLNLDTLQGVRLSGSGSAPLTCPPGDVVFEWEIYKDAPTTERTYITVGNETQTLGGFMMIEGGGIFTWPAPPVYTNHDAILGTRHKKGQRLTLTRKAGLLTWSINGLEVYTTTDNGVEPDRWSFTGPGGYILTSVRVSDG